MHLKLRSKLSLSYILVIVLCVFIISFLSNFILERQFKDYVINKQQQRIRETISLITQRYASYGSFNASNIEDIGMNALENGLILKVLDHNDRVVWDAAVHNNGLCQQMLTNMSANMSSHYANWNGGYEESSHDLTADGRRVGTVYVGYYGPFYFTDNDLDFITTINRLLVWAGTVSILIALVTGILISRQLSKPISGVINKAQRIGQGFFGERIEEKSTTIEIRDLVNTFNGMSETLKKQQEQGRQASMDIAHELRTPLTTVQGNLEAMLDGVMDMDEDRLKILHGEILRINRLVDDLAKLARFESRNLVLNMTDFDVSELIRDIVDSFRQPFERQGKTLSFSGKARVITADRDKISQVFTNLLSNALKFTEPGGGAQVEVKAAEDGVEIIVRDDGIGIPRADLPHIFERFYSRDKSKGGVGIGLTIAKSIVSAHGGSIRVSSQEGEGTEFTVRL